MIPSSVIHFRVLQQNENNIFSISNMCDKMKTIYLVLRVPLVHAHLYQENVISKRYSFMTSSSRTLIHDLKYEKSAQAVELSGGLCSDQNQQCNKSC